MTIEERVDHLEDMNMWGKKDHYASRGVGNAGLTTGIIGTALGVLNGAGGVGGLLGGLGANGISIPAVQELQAKDMEIARLNTDIKLRDANLYSDSKSLELYRYVDGRFREFEAALANQAVVNQANKDSFQIVNERLECAKAELCGAIKRETDARKCADNSIVTYVNATFYPKMVADVTVGTTTTAQTVYNPLPVNNCGCGCCCGCN